MILNGREMISGDSIIMFIVISMLDIIRLMIRNGMKIMKLIWNVVFSLDVMKVGIRMVSGVVFGLLMLVCLDRWMNSFRLEV